LNKVFFNKSEWIAATPFTLCEPTIHRFAILILFGWLYSTKDKEFNFACSSSGNFLLTFCKKKKLIK
jgi:hypothetical protein